MSDTDPNLAQLYSALYDIRNKIIASETEHAEATDGVPESWRESARNLACYLGLRRNDIRPLQVQLSSLGLSSLGRLEAHVLAGIDSVLFALQRMANTPLEPVLERPLSDQFKKGDDKLLQHTEELLGPRNSDRLVRIMVTMPSEAAHDYALVRDLVRTGMEIMRVNCAHDSPSEWLGMVENLHKAKQELKQSCSILFDLCGPKLRTGEIEAENNAIRFKPKRDQRGIVSQPGIAWIGSGTPPSSTNGKTFTWIPVAQGFGTEICGGDEICLTDIPGRKRTFQVTESAAGGAWIETYKTAYLESGTQLKLMRQGKEVATATVSKLPSSRAFITLNAGDMLLLTDHTQSGRSACHDEQGNLISPAQIPCAIPEVFNDLKVGEPILFDDGVIGGIITAINETSVQIHIKNTPPGGAKLRSDKGINLPESHLSLPALSESDKEHLDFIVEHGDSVGLSFVRKPEDISLLHECLAKRTHRNLGVILKIENREAFNNLPALLLTGLQHPPLGVMVARGDLGVELGFERLAEVQEQILWLCEAAHVPVIWATQVLESLVKKGMPSRAEVTDAAMSGRAECVMLNKGPFVVSAVEFLNDVLLCMREHHHKKSPMLRKLKVSEGRFEK